MNRTERQKEGIKKWVSNKCSGILQYCPGLGKTYTSIMVIKRLINKNNNCRILISVPTDVLKTQWTEQLVSHRVFNNCDVEIINTVIKRDWDVDLLIIDEIHTVASNSFKSIFDKVNYKMILGLTGTLERLDGKESIILSNCPVVDKITVSEAVSNNWLSDFRDYKVMIEVDLEEYNEINRKFNLYFAYFDYNFDLAMKCATNVIYRNKYAKYLGLDHKEIAAMAMDWSRCMRARKDFVKSHPKKLEIAHKILDHRLDKKCITFSATIKDAEKIKYGNVLHSKQVKKKRRITMEEFSAEPIGVLNTSKAVDVGADIKGLSVGIVLSCDSSKIRKGQRLGRTVRHEEGKIAEFFTLIIKGTIEDKWFNNSTVNPYITINESQLDEVLNGKVIENRERQNIENIKYRF